MLGIYTYIYIYPVYVTIYATLSTLLALIYDSVTTKTGAGGSRGERALQKAVRCKANKLANSKIHLTQEIHADLSTEIIKNE